MNKSVFPETRIEPFVEPADASDLPAIYDLLDRCGLPCDGLSEHLATALVVRSGRDVIASAALELYGSSALLRSVAVAPEYQGQGIGQRITRAALDSARQHHVTRVYLITETAAEFFPKFGFRSISRSQVPIDVQRSVEFATLCPQSALVMELCLPS